MARFDIYLIAYSSCFLREYTLYYNNHENRSPQILKLKQKMADFKWTTSSIYYA
jgi:hypothetical protein